MSSRLNPDAAEFVPVSPTRMLMLDDAIISASPRLGTIKSLDNVELPTEEEFIKGIAQRGASESLKPSGDDYFMRDNFSTLRNKSKDLNRSAGSELGDDSIISYKASTDTSEHVPFDKLDAIKNMDTAFFGTDNEFNGALGATNVFGKGCSDPMTTSVIGQLSDSPDPEGRPATPGSTTAEAPASPVDDEVPPIGHNAASEHLDEVDRKMLDFGIEDEAGHEDNEGYVTEHRRSPPFDLTFKPIQTFSDTNPFGVFQTPATPAEAAFGHQEQGTTPEKRGVETTELLMTGMTPTSFISSRMSTEPGVAFDDLESPTEVPEFEPAPGAHSSLVATGALSSMMASGALDNCETNVNDITQDLFPDEPKIDESKEEYEETSFSTQVEATVEEPHEEEVLDAAEFQKEEIKIAQDAAEQEDPTKQKDELQTEVHPSSDMDITPEIAQVPIEVTTEEGHEYSVHHTSNVEPEPETKEMKLEFESRIAGAEAIMEERLSADEGFEIISREEINADSDPIHAVIPEPNAIPAQLVDLVTPEPKIDTDKMEDSHESDVIVLDTPAAEVIDLTSSTTELNLVENSDNTHREPVVETVVSSEQNKLLSAIEAFDSAMEQDMFTNETHSVPVEAPLVPIKTETPIETTIKTEPADSFEHETLAPFETETAPIEHETQASIETETAAPVAAETPAPIEPEVSITRFYQTLTPADEPKLSKTETYVTGIEGCEKSPALEETPAGITTPEPIVLTPEPIVPTTEPIVPAMEPIVPVTEPVEPAAPIVEQMAAKSEPAPSQVVTETLIANLEEKAEVAPPSVIISEVTGNSVQTPPPTPAPGPAEEQPPQADILVAAVAAAGAVAAGGAVVTETVKKTTASATAVKKAPGAAAAAKKPTDAKAHTKPATGKPAPAKPAATKAPAAGAKPASAAAKPAGAGAKPAPKTTVGAKPASVPTKTTAAPAKPASGAAKPATTAAKPAAGAKPAAAATAKPTTTAATRAAPPNKLAVSKTATTTLKTSSKPTTPSSNPATPTTPKSPGAKDLVRSPPKAAARSTLAGTARPTTAPAKPLANGDTKPAASARPATAAPAKKALPATAPKPATAKPASAPSAAAKPAAKPAVPKPSAAALAKAKPAPAAPTKPAPAPIKRPTNALAGAKPAEKPGAAKTAAAKPAVNGKTPAAKMVNGVKKEEKKSDKIATKAEKSPVKIEDTALIQEDNVTTSNGLSEHAHIIDDIVNVEPAAIVN